MTDIVTIERDGHLAVVRFNRPEKHNALSFDMFEAIIAAGESVGSDAAVRAVVLCGNGPSFCAGLDFSAMQSLIGDPQETKATLARLFKRDDGPDNVAQRTSYVWKKIDVPVVAALHGAVYGGGFQIALGADLRIAAPASKFSIMEIRYGLVPDMGITQTLPDLLPIDKALELTLSGRVFGSDEAAALNVVTELHEQPLERAMELASGFASSAPSAVKAIKQLYRAAWRADPQTGLQLEEALQRQLIGSPDQLEAVSASVEKRAAVFE